MPPPLRLSEFTVGGVDGGIVNIRKVGGKLRDRVRADLEYEKTAPEKALGS